MRRITIAAVTLCAVAAALSGCGCKVPGVPSTVATVNGKSIECGAYLEQLSKRYGQTALTSMIEQQVLLAWAEKQKVPVTEDQITKQIDVFKRDGVYEDQAKALGESGMKSEVSAMQARINLMRKMAKIPDAEIKQTYEMMKQRYVHGPRKQVELIINNEEKKIDSADKAIKGGKDFTEAAREFTASQLAFRVPIKFWVDTDDKRIPKDLVDAAKSTKLDEVSKPFKIVQPGQPVQYGILRVVGEQGKQDLKLDDVKEELIDSAALQKSQFDPKFTEAFNKQKKSAKIEVKIPEFDGIVTQFKNPPPAMPMMMGGPRQMPQ